MHPASKLVWVLGQHFSHKISFGSHHPISYHHFVLATKQTLLSINLVNHVLLRLISDYQHSSLDLKTIPWTNPKNTNVQKPRCLEAI